MAARAVGAAAVAAAIPGGRDVEAGRPAEEDEAAALVALDRIAGALDAAFLCLSDRQIIEIEQYTRSILAIVLVAGTIFGFATGNYWLGGTGAVLLLLSLPSLYLTRHNSNLIRAMDQVRRIQEGNMALRETLRVAQEATRRSEALAAALQRENEGFRAENERFREENGVFARSLEALEAQNGRLEALKVEHEQILGQQRETLATLREENTAFQAANERLSAEIDRLRGAADEVHGAAERVGGDSVALDEIARALRETRATLAEREALLAQLQNQIRPHASLVAQIDAQKGIIAGLQERLRRRVEEA